MVQYFAIFSTWGSILRIFRGAECEPKAREAGPEASSIKKANYIQCGDASHDSFKGDTEISYIETP